MNPDRKIDAEKMHMLSVKTLKGNIDSASGIDPNLITGHSFDFQLGHGMDTEQKLIGFELKIDIEALGKKNEPLGIKGSYTHEIVFKVENMDDFIDQAEKPEDTVMDYMLMATLVGIAYSTVRGIIFTRTQGTSLNTVILPVVDPKKIIRPDEVNESKPVQEQNTADTLD